MAQRILICAILILSFTTSAQCSYFIWDGSDNERFDNPDNWDVGSGYPGSGDTVEIGTAGTYPELHANHTIYHLIMNGGELDLVGNVLIVSESVEMNSGLIQQGTLIIRGFSAAFEGTNFDVDLDVECDRITLDGGTFDGACVFVNAGGDAVSQGGCTFNGNVSLVYDNPNDQEMYIGFSNGNTFNGDLEITNAGNGMLIICHAGNNFINGNLVVNNTGTADIVIGGISSTVELADGKTIGIGSGGYTGNTLLLYNIHQLGATAQNINLTDSANLILNYCGFEGEVILSAPTILCSYNTFATTTIIEKTGAGICYWEGGNIFNGTTLIANRSTNLDAGQIRLAQGTFNTYYGNVTFSGNYHQIHVVEGSGSDFKGNVTIEDTVATFIGGTALFSGAEMQALTGDMFFDFDTLHIEKSSSEVVAASPLEVSSRILLLDGNIVTDSLNLLTMKAGSVVIGSSDTSFVSGPMKKIGNTAFEFPVGKGLEFSPIEITEPDSITDVFIAEYYSSEQQISQAMDSTIDYINKSGFWKLSRIIGNANPDIFLHWQTASNPILDSADLRVAGWNDSIWKDYGADNFTWISENGKIKNQYSISNYSYFALAYATTPMPYVTLGNDTTVNVASFTYSNVSYFGELKWIPSAGLSCSNCDNPDIDIEYSKKYFLYAYDYKNRLAVDSVLILKTQNPLPFGMFPPAVDWKYEHWASFNPYTLTNQTQEASSDEWWYGHSNSLNQNNEIDGYICAGYASFINQGFDELSNGGCRDWDPEPCTVECAAFELADSGCDDMMPTLNGDEVKRGRLHCSLALKTLSGEEYEWHKTFGIGNFYMAKSLDDNESYLAVGFTESTITPFESAPLIYNPDQPGSNAEICSATFTNGTRGHAYVVKVNKSDGEDQWQYIYGHESLNSMDILNQDYSSLLNNFIEIPGMGYRLVGSCEYSGSQQLITNALARYIYILDIDQSGQFLNSYVIPLVDPALTSVASDIVRFYDGNKWINVISGRYAQWELLPGALYPTISQKVFVSAFDENFGTLNYSQDELWTNFDSFDNNSFTTNDNSANYYLKIGKDAMGDPIILLPVLYGCGQTGLYATDNICEGKIYKIDISVGTVLSEVTVGEVRAFDLKMDVTPTEDFGFALLTTKEGLNHSRTWNEASYCAGTSFTNQPLGYWNTDAFVAKFNAVDTDPEWYIQFDRNDEQPVYYPGDYKKQECMYTITNAADGGFVLAGNSSSNFDDYYLCKLQRDCITRSASFADVLDDVDFISTIGDGSSSVSETWNSSKTVLGSVLVKANATLTITGISTVISFSDSRRVSKTDGHNIITNLVVEPGGSVIIENGAKLDVISSNSSGSCNDGMWDGVQVLGNSSASQNVANQGFCQTNTGATIANARLGIIAGDAAYDEEFEYLVPSLNSGVTGGIIRTFNSNFLNNRESIWISPYQFQSYSVVKISGNNFLCDNTLRDPYYKHPDGRQEGIDGFVTMIQNRNIHLASNSFNGNNGLDVDIRGTAIICNDCSGAINQVNSFTDLTYGIKGNFFNFGGIKSLQILNNDFNNVQAGINLIGNSFSTIRANEFHIPFGQPLFKYPYGVWLDNCNAFSISDENLFNSINNGNNYGVVISNSTSIGGEVSHNQFNDTQTGTQTELDNQALQIRCNVYENHMNAWLINPLNPGSLADQGTNCLQAGFRSGNEFNDNCISTNPIHILSPNVAFVYYASKDVDQQPDPFDNCSEILTPGFIDHCFVQFPETSCDIMLPGGNERAAWFEMIDTTENSGQRQYLWLAFLREIITLDTLGQDTTIISFIDSLDEDVAKWIKVAWYLELHDGNTVDSLLENITLNDAEDSALYSYNSVLLSLLNNEGNYFDLNGDRIDQLNLLLLSTSSVAKCTGALLESAGKNHFNYEPEQFPEERNSLWSNSFKKDDLSFTHEMIVYPNPGNGRFTLNIKYLSSDDPNYSIEIFNSKGERIIREVEKLRNKVNEIKVDLTQYKAGLYFVKVIIGENTFIGKMNNIIQ